MVTVSGNLKRLCEMDFEPIFARIKRSSKDDSPLLLFLVMMVDHETGDILEIADKAFPHPDMFATSIVLEKMSTKPPLYTLKYLGGFQEKLPIDIEDTIRFSFELYNLRAKEYR